MSSDAINAALQGPPALSDRNSPSEELLLKIWSDVLQVPLADPRANFFDIGGDSLKAMETIARIGEVLRVDLPLIAFFEDPTVRHMATVIDELAAAAITPPIARIADRREFPLSYSQQMFWLLEQQNPGTGVYNTHRVFRVRGEVDPVVLERSLNELRRRHEVLAVRFMAGINGPVQVVDTASPLRLLTTDLSALEALERDSVVLNVTLETVREPFNLNVGPVMRARLIRLTIEDYVLALAMHHAVSDGFTGGILFEELGAIYDAFAAGEPNSLAEPELQFTDYAVWEQRWIRGLRIEKELEYWRSVFRGAPSSLDLPTDLARNSELDHSGRLRSVVMPDESFRSLKVLAQSCGSTLFTALAASLRILLYRWSGQGDFPLGTVASNRSRNGTEGMVGCFVNPLPLRNPITDDQSVMDILKAEKVAVMGAFANQDCPFTMIVEAINPERTNNNPLFNVALLFQNFPVIALNGSCFQAEYVNFDAQVALLDLRFVATETSVGLHLSCEYKTQLFSEQTIDTLLHDYGELLQVIANDPARLASGVAVSGTLTRQASVARKRDYKSAIVLVASFTAEPLEERLNFLLLELDLKYHVVLAPYQQVFQQLLDPVSPVRTADGFAVVLVRLEDWLHGEVDMEAACEAKLDHLAGELIEALQAAQDSAAPLILCFCPASEAIGKREGWPEWFRSVEGKVADAFSTNSKVRVIRSGTIMDLYSVAQYEDEYTQRLGNVPYTADFFSALGTMLVRSMWGIVANHYKVIAMDGDQVLWDGYCREKTHVRIDGPRSVFLSALLEQRDAGRLLCLCSKDREEDLWAALESNPAMPLQRDDFVATATSFNSTAENLGRLAAELGLELDSFIFLHSDPVECSEVEASCPEVMTLQVPADPDSLGEWLRHVWAFDMCR